LIPLIDLKAQHRAIRKELDAAIHSVLDNTAFILGSEVAAFEQDFAAVSGAAFGIGTNSGTSALHLALLAAGVGPGDEVITTPFTFVASVASIGYTGATPVLVDIDPATFNIDPAKIEAAITPRTKAILPVHLFGQPADMDPILEIARRHRLVTIEDAAQAHAAEYRGRRCGSLGDIACFSFYPTKNLGACGEAGMVVTNNAEFARTVRLLRDWGTDKKYEHRLRGYNYRMEGLQGAILRVKLRHLEAWTEARIAHAAQYARLLAPSGLALPAAMAGARHVYHTYTIRVPRRDQLQAELQAAGIGTAIHYPIPVHLQPAWAGLGYRRGDLPVAEQAASEVLSLPMYAELQPAQIETVAAELTKLARLEPISRG
jgi:dTDP-4-amino-4,6-dideoxygalactose transaminase